MQQRSKEDDNIKNGIIEILLKVEWRLLGYYAVWLL
jgi:hypothetical protein